MAWFGGWKSFAALAVRVSLERGQIRVHEAWAAVDCGVVVCRDIVRQQIEGGIIFGLSAALKQDITIEDGRVQQTNFHRCDLLRMHECPTITVDVREDSPASAPGGLGELLVPLPAPAVANAVYNLTNARCRLTELPLRLPSCV